MPTARAVRTDVHPSSAASTPDGVARAGPARSGLGRAGHDRSGPRCPRRRPTRPWTRLSNAAGTVPAMDTPGRAAARRRWWSPRRPRGTRRRGGARRRPTQGRAWRAPARAHRLRRRGRPRSRPWDPRPGRSGPDVADPTTTPPSAATTVHDGGVCIQRARASPEEVDHGWAQFSQASTIAAEHGRIDARCPGRAVRIRGAWTLASRPQGAGVVTTRARRRTAGTDTDHHDDGPAGTNRGPPSSS